MSGSKPIVERTLTMARPAAIRALTATAACDGREGAEGPAHEQQEAAALGQAGPPVTAEQLVPR